jgi:hypothetical protein
VVLVCVTAAADAAAGLVPVLNFNQAKCDWWGMNDPCYLRENYTAAESHHAQAVGCGNR